MNQYNPAMSGRRLKSGLRHRAALPEFLQGNRSMHRAVVHLGGWPEVKTSYVGGLSSPTSQPSMSEVMGSFDTTTV
jgi:hypothetical protein